MPFQHRNPNSPKKIDSACDFPLAFEELRARRLALGYPTPGALGAAFGGVAQSTVHRWEAGAIALGADGHLRVPMLPLALECLERRRKVDEITPDEAATR